ncbi:MAG: GGDEF domain-containing protein [Pirellulaceae bacterium]
MARPPQILLLTDNGERRRTWERILQKSVQFWAPPAAPSAGSRPAMTGPEVIVTDHLPVDTHLADGNARLVRGEIGIIAIGTPGPADVSLPADYSARELRLACSLLVEIVRLRCRRGEDKRVQRTLEDLAFRDPLTTLPNRRIWDAQLAIQLADLAAASAGCGTCVVLLDVDFFKRVNDQWGHIQGDEVLRAVARQLVAGVRTRDMVARVGGDEFGLLLRAVEPHQAAAAVERIRRHAAYEAPVESAALLRVTASAGYLFLAPGTGLEPQAAMTQADAFLRQAKGEGRDRTCGGAAGGMTSDE